MINIVRELDRKHVIIYVDGSVWESDVDSHAQSKLDSDKNIIAAFTREHKKYFQVYAIRSMKEAVSIFDED